MTLTKRKQAALQTRENIIQAASTLMEENTLDHIMVEDITKAAGVSKGTFYTYFKKKEDIVEAVGIGRFRQIDETVKKMDGDIEAKIRYLMNSSLKCLQDSGKNLIRQYLINSLNGNMHIDRTSMLKEVFMDAQKKGEISKDAPIDEIVFYMQSVMEGMAYRWVQEKGEHLKEARWVCDEMISEVMKRYKK